MGSPMLGAKLFFLCGLVLVIAGFFLRPSSFPSIDIQVHESYFVVGHFHLLFLSSLALWLYAGFYYLHEAIVCFAIQQHIDDSPFAGHDGCANWIEQFPLSRKLRELVKAPVSPLLVLSAPLGGALFLIGIAMFIVIVILATVARVRRAAV